MATQNQNPQDQANQNPLNQPQHQNPQDQNHNTNPEKGAPSSNPQSPAQPSSENENRGLEQNDHTYEGENDVTHSPKETGEPQSKTPSGEASQGKSKPSPESHSETSQAGYAQQQHDKTPEANAKNANASDPKRSEDPEKGTL